MTCMRLFYTTPFVDWRDHTPRRLHRRSLCYHSIAGYRDVSNACSPVKCRCRSVFYIISQCLGRVVGGDGSIVGNHRSCGFARIRRIGCWPMFGKDKKGHMARGIDDEIASRPRHNLLAISKLLSAGSQCPCACDLAHKLLSMRGRRQENQSPVRQSWIGVSSSRPPIQAHSSDVMDDARSGKAEFVRDSPEIA